jgi:tRNA(Ile)-lysidine synthase
VDILRDFKAFISKNNLFSPGSKLLLAVSGGVDSVVLCELCSQAGYEFIIAHCNFSLRGEESERDADFVKKLAVKYQVEICLKKFDTSKYAAENKLSIQEAARELRYEWFKELITTDDSRLPGYIVTAHHLDDNIETMLMHFFRGTGIQGLRGMLPKQGKIVRPLLFARKDVLKQFADANKLDWVEDSSNKSDKYSRNYIRNQVIPLIQKIYPSTDDNLEHNLARFSEIEVLYEQAIALHKKKLLEKRGEEVYIAVLKLKNSAPLHTIVYEIIKEFGFSPQQTGEVIRLLSSESGKYVQSSTHRIIRNRNWLIIALLQTEKQQTIVIEGDGKIVFEGGELVTEQLLNPAGLHKLVNPAVTGKKSADNNIALIDAKEVRFPLLLRKWKQGDYFYPLGMRKKKKLARFFIDQKLSLADKEKVWVLEMDKKIIWVVGMRIDDRFKITANTGEALRIEFKKG